MTKNLVNANTFPYWLRPGSFILSKLFVRLNVTIDVVHWSKLNGKIYKFVELCFERFLMVDGNDISYGNFQIICLILITSQISLCLNHFK